MSGGHSLIGAEGLTAPISKLIEAVSGAVGTIYEPTRIRRKAKAEADASIIFARADVAKQELLARVAARLSFQELRRQGNVDAIVQESARRLPPQVSDVPTDSDWMARFFDACHDVSDEELRSVWARILAGEVAQPQSFSRRTLTVLRDLSRVEAETFRRVCSLAWHIPDEVVFVPRAAISSSEPSSWGVQYGELLLLEAAGLMHLGSTLDVEMREKRIGYFDRWYSLARDDGALPRLRVYPFSREGIELRRVAGAEPSPDYLAFATRLISDWTGCTLRPETDAGRNPKP